MNTELKYDLESLRELSAGDEAFFKEMVELFLQSTSRSLTAMQQAAGENQLKLTGDLAHKMRGPCNHIGAVAFAELLEKIENKAEQASADEKEILSLVRQAVNEGETLMNSISTDTGIRI